MAQKIINKILRKLKLIEKHDSFINEKLEDLEKTRDILMKISIQRGDLSDDSDETIRQGMLKTAGKRMGMVFTPEKIVSWDQSKLGGVY